MRLIGHVTIGLMILALQKTSYFYERKERKTSEPIDTKNLLAL